MTARDDQLRRPQPTEVLLSSRLQAAPFCRGSRHCNPWVSAMRDRVHPLTRRERLKAHIREQLPHLRF